MLAPTRGGTELTALLRLSALRERLRSSLWFLPSVTVLLSLAAAIFLTEFEKRVDIAEPVVGFAGTPEGARAVLATVAGSTITVTGLTFSLTVVALQVAASQFTPRLLSTFLADRGNQAVLSTFLSTFVYTLAVLRSVRSAADGGSPFVPDIAVAVGLGLTMLSIAMLVYFFDHLTQQLRVETVLGEVQDDTLALVRQLGPSDLPAPVIPAAPEGALVVRAKRSGYLQAVQLDVLKSVAEKHGLVVRLRPAIGAHVSKGTTLAWAWPVDGGELEVDSDAVSSAVHGGVHLGRERTMQHDIAFGIRQLVDISARALSPGINDPTTGAMAIATMAPVLVEITRGGLRPWNRADDDDRLRVAVPQPTFAELLGLACDQPRRYGADEPAVLTELLRLLTDVAEVAGERVDHVAIRTEIDRTVAAAESAGMNDDDLARIRAAASHARAALSRGSRVSEVANDVEGPAD